MLSTRNIERSANPLRLLFSSDDRTSTGFNVSTFDVSLENYVDRFDMTRPIYVAVETFVIENNTPSKDVSCLVWSNCTNDVWSSHPILMQCIAVTRNGISSGGRVTRDTLGTPINRGVLVGGAWTFMITDVNGDLMLDTDLNAGYLFTLVLWQ
jgi:hypothetical protein